MTVEPLQDPFALPVAARLVECLCDEIRRSPGGEVCWCGLLPGDTVAWEYCNCETADCGMAWVRVAQIFPSTTFPRPATDWRACGGAPLVAEMEIGVLRCAPLGDNGEPASEVDQFDAAQIAFGDMFAIWRAVTCCAQPKRPHLMDQWQPLGPDGGCVGGQWRVYMEVHP